MFSQDSCINITFVIILIFLVYLLFRNRSENFEIEGFVDVNERKLEHKENKLNNIPIVNNLELNEPKEIIAKHIISNEGIHSKSPVPMVLGDIEHNQYALHTPQDGRKQLWIAPRKVDNSDWDWGYSLSIDSINHTVSTNGNQLQLSNDFMLSGDSDGWLRTRTHDNKSYKNFAGDKIWADNGILSQGCDFVLGQNCGRGDAGPSRALVKDNGPQLVINYANDFKAGTRVDGDLHVNKLWVGDRWSIEPEGNVLVFRDNKTGGDNRYAMLSGQGNNKNL